MHRKFSFVDEMKYWPYYSIFRRACQAARGDLGGVPNKNKKAKGLGKQVLLPHPIPWRGFDGGFLF
jgi:hypothetical protein